MSQGGHGGRWGRRQGRRVEHATVVQPVGRVVSSDGKVAGGLLSGTPAPAGVAQGVVVEVAVGELGTGEGRWGARQGSEAEVGGHIG